MWMEVALHVNFFMPWTGIPALQNLLKERTSFQAVNFDTHPFQISIHTEIHHIKLPFRASGQNFACLSHFSCIIAACLVSLILLNLMTMEYLVQCIAYAAVHCACCVWLCYILLNALFSDMFSLCSSFMWNTSSKSILKIWWNFSSVCFTAADLSGRAV